MASKDFLSNGSGTDYDKLQTLSFTSKESELLDYAQRYVNGEIKQGLTTGFKELDEYYLFKEGDFDIWLGHDNVGKSVLLWFLLVVANVLHGKKAIIKSSENKIGTIYRRMIEFKYMKDYKGLEVSERDEAHKWFINNFTLMNNHDIQDAPVLLGNVYQANSIRKHDMFLIDPYNSLPFNKGLLRGMSTHDYHYQIATQIRILCDKTGMNVHMNCHAVTDALRNRHGNEDILGYSVAGMAKAPHKADAEGGGKWSNRADNFMTVHRYIQHPELFRKTLVFIRKIKETETGGQPTRFDPVSLTLGDHTFTDALQTNPFTKKLEYKDEIDW